MISCDHMDDYTTNVTITMNTYDVIQAQPTVHAVVFMRTSSYMHAQPHARTHARTHVWLELTTPF